MAANKCQAKVAPELAIKADNVTVNGVSITSSGTALSVSNPGARVLNNCIQGFGKTTYANGIWVYLSALNPSNRVIVEGNTLDDWGGVQYAGGIAVGKAADNPRAQSQIGVEIKNNRVTNGPTAGSLWSAGIRYSTPRSCKATMCSVSAAQRYKTRHGTRVSPATKRQTSCLMGRFTTAMTVTTYGNTTSYMTPMLVLITSWAMTSCIEATSFTMSHISDGSKIKI